MEGVAELPLVHPDSVNASLSFLHSRSCAGTLGLVFLCGVCVEFGVPGCVCFPSSPSLSSSQTQSPS